jgi:tetratricopeptide (TPR) repeat protein
MRPLSALTTRGSRFFAALGVIAIAASVVLADIRVASASPTDDLAEARAVFRRGDYELAIPLLSSLLYPNSRLSRQADLAEAHLLLGVAYYETGRAAPAEREFEEALFVDPELTLDGIFSDEVARFFRRTKEAIQRRRDEEERLRSLAEERDTYRLALENMYVVEKRNYFVNFVPFGAGQFQNGQTEKGVAFAVSQGLLGGTSMAMFAIQQLQYNPYRPEDVDTINRMRLVQLSTGGLTLAIMAWGIIDALANYEPTVERRADESLLPDDFPGLRPGEPSTSSLRLGPSLSPRGAGFFATWEF